MTKIYKMPCGVVKVAGKRVRAIAHDGTVLHDKTYRNAREASAFARRVTTTKAR